MTNTTPTTFPNDKSDAIWKRKADELVELARDGRRPARCAPDANERALYTWHTRNRLAKDDGSLSVERQAYFEEFLPGWDQNNGDSVIGTSADPWVFYADRLRDFITANGRMPKRRGAETPIRNWLMRARSRELDSATALHPLRRAYLDTAVPGWQTT